jgi:uncharacterized membrane protein YdbT with pleckstrin-like domain
VSYVDQHLNPGESVIYRATLHPVIFSTGALLALFSLVFFMNSETVGIGGFIFLIALIALGITWLRSTNSEFAVTSTRVVIKVGWLTRRTLELQLSKVETIGIDQVLLGRLLDYGTLVVIGTGGTKETFKFISAPLEFRKAVQRQTEAVSNVSTRPAVAASSSSIRSANEARVERECPYCAEMILAKANRCRFCSQTVTPVVA